MQASRYTRSQPAVRHPNFHPTASIALLERRGELARKELVALVWPNIFLEPISLKVHISALRRALRDGKNDPVDGVIILADPVTSYRRDVSVKSRSRGFGQVGEEPGTRD
jgi:hypothetical protein